MLKVINNFILFLVGTANLNGFEFILCSASGRNAKERWKLFKNISRFGILQRNPTEEDNLSSRSSLYTPFKRTSSNFYGSRLWSDLPLPIDECNDNDFDFPMLRKKHHNDNEKAFRVTSLQLNVTPKNKQPLARHISSPTRFNYSTKLKDNNRTSDGSSFSSKMSIRGFIRRMSERRQRPTAESDFMRDRRKTAVNKTMSIRSINEEEVKKNTFEEGDENVDRVVSYISKCCGEIEDDTSISKVILSFLNGFDCDFVHIIILSSVLKNESLN
ncbi:hypothetical protein ACKWTF_007112 [Chironomus riparius]